MACVCGGLARRLQPRPSRGVSNSSFERKHQLTFGQTGSYVGLRPQQCGKCGSKNVDVRPNWKEQPAGREPDRETVAVTVAERS